jgi:hypothetical protein
MAPVAEVRASRRLRHLAGDASGEPRYPVDHTNVSQDALFKAMSRDPYSVAGRVVLKRVHESSNKSADARRIDMQADRRASPVTAPAE